MNRNVVTDYLNVGVSCQNPLLIIHPSCREFALTCDEYYIDGVHFVIDSDKKCKLLKNVESVGKILNLPYVHSLDDEKLSKLSDKDIQDFSERLARFVNDSFFVNSVGATFPIFTFVPCGKCDVCLHSKLVSYLQRAQMAFEESMRPVVFATLTYNDKNLPVDGVNIRDIQLFKKKFKRIFDSLGLCSDGIKFIISSEYGHKTHRPHYHCLIFGIPQFFGEKTSVCEQDYYVNQAVRYAWRNPERISDLRYRPFMDFCSAYNQLYNRDKDYDVFSKGFCNVSILDSSSQSCVSYVLKYISKDNVTSPVYVGKTKNFISVSQNLGVKFVKDNFYFEDFKFYSCSGQFIETKLCGYYLKSSK